MPFSTARMSARVAPSAACCGVGLGFFAGIGFFVAVGLGFFVVNVAVLVVEFAFGVGSFRLVRPACGAE